MKRNIRAPGKIIGVAIRINHIMVCLPKPNRHCDCAKYAVQVLGLPKPIGNGPDDDQGFYTDQGYFLNRKAAKMIAIDNDQLIDIEDANS
jgi:hypothetical protein